MSTVGLLLSGGPDSSSLAYELVSKGYKVIAFTFNTGEFEAEAEMRCAKKVSEELQIEHVAVNFTGELQRLYNDPLPVLMRKVQIVSMIKPFGSGVALSLAASASIFRGASALYYGVHKGDSMFLDNTHEYFESLNIAIAIERGTKDFRIEVPYLDISKAEVMKRGIKYGLNLANTWSCASNSLIPCGKCPPCEDRKEAFVELRLEDPLLREGHRTLAEQVH